MVGAYAALWALGVVSVPFIGGLGIGFWPGVVVALLVAGLVGAIIEAVFIRQVYDREPLDQLLLTFAFVLMLTDAIRTTFGTGSNVVQPPAILRGDVVLASGLSLPAYRAFLIAMSIVVLAALFVILRTTNIGRLVRATSSDRDMAALLGVNVPRLYTLVFFVGAALAGLGGALAIPTQSVTPSLGNQVIINAFVIAVIGGLGSFTGAFVGAYLVGVSIAVGSLIVAGAGQLIPFVAMIIVLLLKPEGLFGGAEA
jgi:branched-subunit amino acid ABC-type transport system permease component